jgi:hypothetical protein
LKALFDVMDGMDFVDDMDTEKIHQRGCVHSVHKVHSVHYLDEFNWLQLPNLVLPLAENARTCYASGKWPNGVGAGIMGRAGARSLAGAVLMAVQVALFDCEPEASHVTFADVLQRCSTGFR